MSDSGWSFSPNGLLVPPGNQGAAPESPQSALRKRIKVRDVQYPPNNKNGRGWNPNINNEDYVYETRETLDCGSIVVEYKNGHMEPVCPPQFVVHDNAWDHFQKFMDYQRGEGGRGRGSLTSFMQDNSARLDYSMPEIFFRMWAAERGLVFEDIDIETDLDMKKDLFAFWKKRYSGNSPFTMGNTEYD